MVKNSDIKCIVTTTVAGKKNEIKTEVIKEIKDSLTKELQGGVTAQVKEEFENKRRQMNSRRRRKLQPGLRVAEREKNSLKAEDYS